MRKISFLLAIVLLLSIIFMAGCNNPVPPSMPPQGTTPEQTTPEDVGPLFDPALSISLEQLANYEIVYAKNSSKEVKADVKKLVTALYDTFDAILGQRSDLYYEGVENLAKGQYEILIGHTNREESNTLISTLKWDDYGYAMVGDKLIIAGKNEDGTLKALRAFLEYVAAHKGDKAFFDNTDQTIVAYEYPFKEITINGIAASELSILCNEEELDGVAEHIRDAVIDACGIALPILCDADVETLKNVIVIGDTAHIDVDSAQGEIAYPTYEKYCINQLPENVIWVSAKNVSGYWSAAVQIARETSGKGAQDVILPKGMRDDSDMIAAMSFNLMAGIRAGDARVESVINTILKYRPAVVGVQEATDTWIGLIKQKLGDLYTVVGVGRNADGGDEHSAILYLTAEFECVESGTKWLSDTPDVPGSKFASSHYTRIMTYALLQRRSDGRRLLHVNTHLDYGSSATEEQVKVDQLQVIFDEIEKFEGVSTIITGDFNATVDSPAYQKMLDAGYFSAAKGDAYDDDANTYHGLMGTTGAPSHIDYVFAKNLDQQYCDYRVIKERVDNENVSDHYPILALLSLHWSGK